jgi:GMP synthase (glutamine-hydrolysing)
MSNVKPFLVLQLRPEDAAADNEFEAMLQFGGLDAADVRRIRMEREPIPDINLEDYSAVIIGGGPSSVSEHEEKKSPEQKRFESELLALLRKIDTADFPYLGACYGLGILSVYLGGKVSKRQYSESVGAVTVDLAPAARDDPLTQGLPAHFRAFVGHKEASQDVPPGAVLLAGSASCPVQMIRYKQNIYATQFHPELDTDGLTLRIKIYRHAGYFPPEDAETLIVAAQQEHVSEPQKILKGFVARYAQQA